MNKIAVLFIAATATSLAANPIDLPTSKTFRLAKVAANQDGTYGQVDNGKRYELTIPFSRMRSCGHRLYVQLEEGGDWFAIAKQKNQTFYYDGKPSFYGLWDAEHEKVVWRAFNSEDELKNQISFNLVTRKPVVDNHGAWKELSTREKLDLVDLSADQINENWQDLKPETITRSDGSTRDVVFFDGLVDEATGHPVVIERLGNGAFVLNPIINGRVIDRPYGRYSDLLHDHLYGDKRKNRSKQPQLPLLKQKMSAPGALSQGASAQPPHHKGMLAAGGAFGALGLLGVSLGIYKAIVRAKLKKKIERYTARYGANSAEVLAVRREQARLSDAALRNGFLGALSVLVGGGALYAGWHGGTNEL